MEELSESKKIEYKEVFDLYDRIGKGQIPLKDLGLVLRALMRNPSEAELRDFIRKFDEDHAGTISFDDFLCVLRVCPLVKDTAEDIIEAFRVFDKDGNGFIGTAELRYFMTNYGDKLSVEEVDDMIKDADVHGDGQVNYEEFVHVMASKIFIYNPRCAPDKMS